MEFDSRPVAGHSTRSPNCAGMATPFSRARMRRRPLIPFWKLLRRASVRKPRLDSLIENSVKEEPCLFSAFRAGERGKNTHVPAL